jgi:hypothetical protein
VQLSADREFVYCSPWSGKQSRKYDRQAGHVVETANVRFYPDNTSNRADGMLIVTGMDELQSWKRIVKISNALKRLGFRSRNFLARLLSETSRACTIRVRR